MNAASIKLGQEYAVELSGREIAAVRITEQHTVRTRDKTVNYFNGHRIDEPHPIPEDWNGKVKDIKAADVKMPLEEHKELVRQREERDAAIKAESDRNEAERFEVIGLLSSIIGLPGQKPGERRYGHGLIFTESFESIEIRQEALPYLRAILIKHVTQGEPS